MINEDFDAYLSEEKTLEGRRHELVKALLKEREAFVQEIDQKLARLGHKATPRRGRPRKDQGVKAAA